MKALIVIAGSALLLAGCGKYGSLHEAEVACEEWAKKRGSLTVKGVTGDRTVDIRYCRQESETRQILGFEAQPKPGHVLGSVLHELPDRTVVTRYRY